MKRTLLLALAIVTLLIGYMAYSTYRSVAACDSSHGGSPDSPECLETQRS